MSNMDTLKKMKVISILWGMILFTLLILLVAASIIFKEKSKKYEEEENRFKEVVKSYVEDNNLYPDKNKSLKVEDSELIDANLMESIIVNNDECRGYVIITNKKNNYEYKAYIKCKKYITGNYNKN